MVDGNPLYELLKLNYPYNSRDDYARYLYNMTNSSCGYMSLTDGIIDLYQGLEYSLEKNWGISPFSIDEKGHLDYNYEAFTFTIFDKYFNKYENKFEVCDNDPFGWYHASVSTYEKIVNEIDTSIKITHEYIGTAESINKSSFAEKCNQLLESGAKIALGGANYNMSYYNENNELKKTHIDGGHLMYITEVTDDHVKVSSWGEEYYIYLDTYHQPENASFDIVVYTRDNTTLVDNTPLVDNTVEV